MNRGHCWHFCLGRSCPPALALTPETRPCPRGPSAGAQAQGAPWCISPCVGPLRGAPRPPEPRSLLVFAA